MFISYARDGEDVVLARVFGDVRRADYLDVGAGDGRATRRLQEIGWRGVLVSADETERAELTLERPGSAVLAADASPGDISAALEAAGIVHLGVLRIAVTFCDGALIAEAELTEWHPRVVVVGVSPTRLAASVLGAALRSAGYVVGCFDGVNCYLALAADEDALSRLYPACSLDEYVTAEVAAMANELASLRASSAGLERDAQQASGGDRGVLTAPSSQRRRYAARHDLVRTPMITLDRVAMPTTAETGSGELATLLAAALEVEVLQMAHPADVEWDRLPDRVVLVMPSAFSELLRVRLSSNAFRVVAVTRHPLDVELARQQRMSTTATAATGFLTAALSSVAEACLEANSRWLVEPGTARVEYEELSGDPLQALVGLYEGLGISIDNVSRFSERLSPLARQLQADLGRLAVDRAAVSTTDEARFSATYAVIFERLGIEPPATDAVTNFGTTASGDGSTHDTSS